MRDLLVSSISSSLAYGMGRMSVVNTANILPDAHQAQVERGAAAEKAQRRMRQLDNDATGTG